MTGGVNSLEHDVLVSVVIPAYNRDESLKRAISSVEKQTYSHIELFVIDDSTVKKEKQFFQEYSIPIMYYYKDKERKGPQESRNKGLSLANGEYIAFLDDDDEWLPTKIEKQVNAMNPDVDLSVTWILDKRFGKERVNKTPVHPERQYVLDAFSFQSTSAYMFRTKKLKEIGGFDETFASAHEYEVAIRLSKEGKITSVPEVLVIQNRSEGQLSENWRKKIDGIMSLRKKYKKDFGLLNNIKSLGLIFFYSLGYLFGNRIYSILLLFKEMYSFE